MNDSTVQKDGRDKAEPLIRRFARRRDGCKSTNVRDRTELGRVVWALDIGDVVQIGGSHAWDKACSQRDNRLKQVGGGGGVVVVCVGVKVKISSMKALKHLAFFFAKDGSGSPLTPVPGPIMGLKGLVWIIWCVRWYPRTNSKTSMAIWTADTSQINQGLYTLRLLSCFCTFGSNSALGTGSPFSSTCG